MVWDIIIDIFFKFINEGLIGQFKRFANWIRNSPIKISSLFLYIAIGSIDEDKFDTFCEKLKTVYNFEIYEVNNDLILTHTRTLVISKSGLVLKLCLVNTPSFSPYSIMDSYTIKVELMNREISYRDGIGNLKLILNNIITCSQNVFKSNAKFTYRMPLNNTKKVDTKEPSYKIHIYGSKATVESDNLDNLQKLIILDTA